MRLEAHITDIDYELAAQWEKELRHDVMAHIHTYGELSAPRPCPSSIWGPPAAMWGTIPTLSSCGRGCSLVRDKLVRVHGPVWPKFAERV